MALETATYIDGLVATNPAASDAISTADDHLRLIKSTLKTTFPNINGAVTVTPSQLNDVVNKAPIASPTFTGTPAAPTASAGTNTTQVATTAFVKTAVDAAMSALYPVGSIYTNAANSTNPATLLGFGTWVAFGAGRVMVGFNASDPLFDTAEETGGSKDAIVVSHTHTYSGSTSTNGSHVHETYHSTTGDWDYTRGAEAGGGFGGDKATKTYNTNLMGAAGDHSHTFSGTTASSGSSGTNANIQPYITVYMWKRTA